MISSYTAGFHKNLISLQKECIHRKQDITQKYEEFKETKNTGKYFKPNIEIESLL